MISEYLSYTDFLHSIGDDNVFLQFKNNKTYRGVLEHLSIEHGQMYLDVISIEFPDISFEIIKKFVEINDFYGNPIKGTMLFRGNIPMDCSPTSIRYVYHALVILKYYNDTECENMVEVGCGYGGLFLAINYFAKFMNSTINKYNMVDLKDVGLLIDKYINANSANIHIPYGIYDASFYGAEIEDTKLFFISNYCFTEIDLYHRKMYEDILLKKTTNGFITWQTCFDHIPINNIQICKSIKNREPERPNYCDCNFFVYY
jgi:hypothetical protein